MIHSFFWKGLWGNRHSYTPLMAIQMVEAQWKATGNILQKLPTYAPFNLAVRFLGIYSEDTCSTVWKHTHTTYAWVFRFLFILESGNTWSCQSNGESVQFSSVTQSCPILCDPMNCSTPGLPVHHHLPEFTQTHVHQVHDAIQPSHLLSSPSPPAPNPSQHQRLFQWVNSSHKLESRLPGEISITSDMQMTPPLWQKAKN